MISALKDLFGGFLIAACIFFVIVSLVTAIFPVPDPDKAKRPDLENIPVLKTQLDMKSRHAITWTFKTDKSWPRLSIYARRERNNARLALRELKRQLASGKGWRRSGIYFVYVTRPSTANILITSGSQKYVQAECSPKAAACADVNKYWCDISLTYYFRSRPSTSIVNHELGHCFGLDHTEGGLMDPDGNVKYPSDRLISWLKYRIAGR